MTRATLFCAVVLLLAATGLVNAQVIATTPDQDEGRGFAMTLFGGGNFLGVTTESVTRETQGRYNLSGEPRGVAVLSVAAGSPAAKAGLQKGDVILRFDGETVSSVQKLQRLISEAAPEHATRLTISRNGAEQDVSVTLARREEFPRVQGFKFGGPGEEFQLGEGWPKDNGAWQKQMDELHQKLDKLPQQGNSFVLFGNSRRIGVTTTPLTAQLADYFGIAGRTGMLVTSVAENSPAAKAGLRAGDIITDVDGEKISATGDLVRALGRRDEGDVTLNVTRDKQTRTVKVTPERAQPSTLFGPDTMPMTFAMPRISMRLPRVVVPRVKLTTPRAMTLRFRPVVL
jgi:serine protease Do